MQMKNILLLFLIAMTEIYPQPRQIKNFFDDLIKNEKDLHQYLHPDEFKKSTRLGIKYKDVTNKFLISYDIDEPVKQKVIKGELSYQVSYEQSEDDFAKAVFKISDNNYS